MYKLVTTFIYLATPKAWDTDFYVEEEGHEIREVICQMLYF